MVIHNHDWTLKPWLLWTKDRYCVQDGWNLWYKECIVDNKLCWIDIKLERK